MQEMDEEVGCDSELLDWFYLDNWQDMSIALSMGMHADVDFLDEDSPPDDTRESLGVDVFFSGIDVDYPMTIRSFLEAVIDLYDTTDIVETWRALEEQVHEVEGIRMRVSRTPFAPGHWDDFAAGDYAYVRAAPGSWTVAKWRRTRLEPQLPTHSTAEICAPDGKHVSGQTRLSTLRKAWASSTAAWEKSREDRVFEVMRDTRWAGYILSITDADRRT